MKDVLKDIEYIDFHTHMHDKAFDHDSDQALKSIIDKKVAFVTVGTDIIESRKAKSLSDQYDNVFYTIGVHPHDDMGAVFDETNIGEFEKLLYVTDQDNNFVLDDSKNKILNKKCIAIGECGLDYFYEDNDVEKLRQEKLFKSQIEFALKHDKPLMIHGRPKEDDDAYIDIIKVLQDYKSTYKEKIRGNMHFFVGSIDTAQKCMDLGFTFSFGGVLTLTHDYDELIKYIPIEYINVETDSPYVTPKDESGKKIDLSNGDKSKRNRNSSENIDVIVSKIAQIKGLDLSFVKDKMKENFTAFINN